MDRDDTGIACGSGTAAFDIFDQGAFRQQATRFYDRDGNLIRRVLHERYTSGTWSNPLSGASVSYTQNNIITNLLAVPGDFDSATETIRGEVIIRGRTAAPVFIAVGRQVFNFDESELISSAGRNDFIAAFFEADPTAFDAVCAALA
jgi:hypothetical protein